MVNEPSVYVGVPTGDSKEYALLYMLASIRDVDYPSDKLSFNISITNLGRKTDDQFTARVRQLVEASNFPFETNVMETYPQVEDMKRWGAYYAVITNLHKLRVEYLKTDKERFWLLGGDNPPPRFTLRKLLEVDADVVSALMKQRTTRLWDEMAKGFLKDVDPSKVYGMYWSYVWHMEDLEPLNLEPALKEALRTAWLEHIFLGKPRQPSDEEQNVIRRVVFGSGCSLIKRFVLEHFGYALGCGGTHSEDLHFANMVNFRGWTTAMRLDAPCMHFDVDGKCFV